MFLDDKLIVKLKPAFGDVEAEVVQYIEMESLACVYSGEDISNFTFIVVLRGDGKVGYFKTIQGVIIEDEADRAYTNSRELVGLSDKNIDVALKVKATKVGKDGFLNWRIDKLPVAELRRILANTRRPRMVKYVVGLGDNFSTVQMSADKSLMEGSSYKTVLDCLRVSYIDRMGFKGDTKNLDYHIVRVG